MIIDGVKHRTVQGMIEDIEGELIEWARTRKNLQRMGRELCQDSLKIVAGLSSRLERLKTMPRGHWVPVTF